MPLSSTDPSASSSSIVGGVPAMLETFYDFAAVLDSTGVVLATNGRCPCGERPCPSSTGDFHVGSDASTTIGTEFFAAALETGRHRTVARFAPHGGDGSMEATLTWISGTDRLLLLALRDLTDVARVAERNLLLAGEMRHRLGNTYAIAMAIISASGSDPDPTEVALRRLGALAHVQSLGRDASGMALSTMASEIRASVVEESVSASVPDFDADLDMSQAQALLLVAGELCANSLKHGALKHGGSVAIGWRRTIDGIAMDWVETSPVPPVRSMREGSSGFRIMSGMMRSVRGRLVDEWPEMGLRVTAMFLVRVRQPD